MALICEVMPGLGLSGRGMRYGPCGYGMRQGRKMMERMMIAVMMMYTMKCTPRLIISAIALSKLIIVYLLVDDDGYNIDN